MASTSEEESAASDLSSDEELQVSLAQGTLKPGLNVEVAPPRTYTNNVSGLREKLAALKRKGQTEWLERMDVTPLAVSLAPSTAVSGEEGGEGEEGLPDSNDDFKREMWFYQQAQSAVAVGQRKLEELEIAMTRPEDYFAEMVKTDGHMRKVRERLLSRQKVLEQREKARKLRELKKFGKKVQQDILQKRREEKKSALEAVKKFRKGRGEKPGFLQGRGRGADKEEEEFAVSASVEGQRGKGGERRKGQQVGSKSKKQQFKDKKFGFGGKKRGQKGNSAASSADMSEFNSARHSKSAAAQGKRGGGGAEHGGRGGGKKNQRFGKARRQKMQRGNVKK